MSSSPSNVGSPTERYVLLDRLAIGGMSEVFFARQQGSGGFSRLVVVKQLLPTCEEGDSARLLDEARLAASLSHENVVTIIDVGSREGRPFVAMEYVHGVAASTLWKRTMQRAELVPVVAAARIVQDAARGLHHAHIANGDDGRPLGIVHRDVAPKNILLRVDGTAKIADFGIAFARERLAHTQTGAVPGTLPYMAPEQARMHAVSTRSDQFSLGVVLWEMMTGLRLFKGESQSSTLKKLLRMPILPPSSYRPGLGRGVDEVTLRMLARDPAERFASMADVVTALDAALPGLSGDSGRNALADAVALHRPELEARERRIRASRTDGTEVSDLDTVLCTSPNYAPSPKKTEEADEADDAKVDTTSTRPQALDHADKPPPPRAPRRPPHRVPTRVPAPAPAARARFSNGAAVVTIVAVAISGFVGASIAIARHGRIDGEALTRAYLAEQQRTAPLLVHANLMIGVAHAHIPPAQVAAVSDELADIEGARLDASLAHFSKPAQQRAAERAIFEQRNKRLDDEAARVLAAASVPADVALHVRRFMEDASAIPIDWLPPNIGREGEFHELFDGFYADAVADIGIVIGDDAKRAGVVDGAKLVADLQKRAVARVALAEQDWKGDDVSSRLHKLDDSTRAVIDAAVADPVARDRLYTLWHERVAMPLRGEPEPLFGPMSLDPDAPPNHASSAQDPDDVLATR